MPVASSYIINYRDVRLTVKKFKTSKSYRIIVHADGSVVLTCPLYATEKRAISFVIANYDWLKKILQKKEQTSKKNTNFIEQFSTKKRTLIYKAVDNGTMLRSRITDTEINIYYPSQHEISDPKIQTFVKKTIIRALRMEAGDYVPARIKLLADRNALKFKGVQIGTATSRWGCCSMGGRIIISCFVMLLPDELIDLVLLHELCHLVHFNHSPAFHKKLNSMLDNHNEDELNKQLKNFRINYLK